jgi:hypothetical protein
MTPPKDEYSAIVCWMIGVKVDGLTYPDPAAVDDAGAPM